MEGDKQYKNAMGEIKSLDYPHPQKKKKKIAAKDGEYLTNNIKIF